ncbi:vasculin-like [Osmerus eperlanus]|uniref:vasculin-like n=1 Tax=Osmerus eperlanus TaxID=29151 RepID=UPI002E135B28
MAQHDFTPAWLNFPTAPSPAKPSHSYESTPDRLDNQGNVSRRCHNSSDGSESVNGRIPSKLPSGGYSRIERNGWKVLNGTSEGSSPRAPLQYSSCDVGPSCTSKIKGLQEHDNRENGDKRKKFAAEDFPSLNPDAEREVNRNKAAGVWEHPPNPQSRGSKMMVIRRISREESLPALSSTSPAQQQGPSRNGTGPSLNKGPIPKSVSLPVKVSRSSSSSPVEQGSQPRLMMRLTRMRSDKKSHFLKALKQDMVGEEKLHLHCKDEDSFHLHNNNLGGGDENLNGYERGTGSSPLENGNSKPSTMSMRQQVLCSSTFPQQEVLSSSLEAEHRLLKEMGWQEESENDETCAPLTEDEMREFQAISEQLQKNGLRKNGLLKNSPPSDPMTAWRTTNFKIVTNTTEETETSSSDTSDDEA